VSLACPECGYDRSGDAAARCPECGSLRRGPEGPREGYGFLWLLLACVGAWWLFYLGFVLRVYHEGIDQDFREKAAAVGVAAVVGVGTACAFLAWRRAEWVSGWAWWVKLGLGIVLIMVTFALLDAATAGLSMARQ
jgi:hypothetical protein